MKTKPLNPKIFMYIKCSVRSLDSYMYIKTIIIILVVYEMIKSAMRRITY